MATLIFPYQYVAMVEHNSFIEGLTEEMFGAVWQIKLHRTGIDPKAAAELNDFAAAVIARAEITRHAAEHGIDVSVFPSDQDGWSAVGFASKEDAAVFRMFWEGEIQSA
ncbi:hypothetical protein [Caenispirillum salinarum]|uniref:hypothetical protein n=1 Tax=Caenispirillum salinarum TaxID=859058 RepID=UPI00384C0ABA